MTRYRSSPSTPRSTPAAGPRPGRAPGRVPDFQKAYVADPGWAFLVFLDHAYVVRDGWTGSKPMVEPHDHGLIHGPWWNLEEWTPVT